MPPLFKDPKALRDIRVIGVVGFAHGTSHFFHLLLPPLFPWLMQDFSLNFTQVGALMTIFFIISGIGQALAGFAVDRIGPRRVLLFGVSMLALSGFTLALATHYWMLAVSAGLAGLGQQRVPSGRLHHPQPPRVSAETGPRVLRAWLER